MDSNHRPYGYEPYALANWATSPNIKFMLYMKKWDLQGSNLWPSACKADALPAELRSHIKYLQYIIVNDPDGVRTHDLRRDRAAL